MYGIITMKKNRIYNILLKALQRNDASIFARETASQLNIHLSYLKVQDYLLNFSNSLQSIIKSWLWLFNDIGNIIAMSL